MYHFHKSPTPLNYLYNKLRIKIGNEIWFKCLLFLAMFRKRHLQFEKYSYQTSKKWHFDLDNYTISKKMTDLKDNFAQRVYVRA